MTMNIDYLGPHSKGKRPRIFIGLIEIANLGAAYAKAFQELGCPTYTVMIAKNPYFTHEEYNIVISENVRRFKRRPISRIIATWIYALWLVAMQFVKALINCDIFIFICGSSFLPKWWDYAIVKFFHKKIVSVFCGCDIRHWSAYEQEFNILGLDKSNISICHECNNREVCYLTSKLENIKTAEKYSDLILSQRNMSQLVSRHYMRNNLPLVVNDYVFNVPGRDVPLIVHAPSDRTVKGTKYVLAAINCLETEGIKLKFQLIEKTGNLDLRKILTDADIVVDQLFAQTVPMLALEAMATGNAVLGGNRTDYELIPGECPVISVNPANIYDRLKQVILDKELRTKLANEGRRYVETYHDHIAVATQILKWLEPGGIQKYDYYPEFDKKHYKIPQQLLEEEKKVLSKPFLSKCVQLLHRLNKISKDN